MMDFVCPLCGEELNGEEGCRTTEYDDEFYSFHCKHFSLYFKLNNRIFDLDESLQNKILNLVTEQLIRQNLCQLNGGKKQWHFYFNDTCDGAYSKYPEYVNIADLINNYPIHTLDIAHRALVNLSIRFPHFGDSISLSKKDKRITFENELNNVHQSGMIHILNDLGYVKESYAKYCYSITADGWQKIDELLKEEQIISQGFIAMAFRAETYPIREAFRTAMTEAGYSVAIIDEKEHNNQIVPEIFFEIERSKFVVVDVTYPNYGAYYEAGYAQALKKEVIICCRKQEFNDRENPNRPHFDISQKSMVVWENETDLIAKLKRRIEATVR